MQPPRGIGREGGSDVSIVYGIRNGFLWENRRRKKLVTDDPGDSGDDRPSSTAIVDGDGEKPKETQGSCSPSAFPLFPVCPMHS